MSPKGVVFLLMCKNFLPLHYILSHKEKKVKKRIPELICLFIIETSCVFIYTKDKTTNVSNN